MDSSDESEFPRRHQDERIEELSLLVTESTNICDSMKDTILKTLDYAQMEATTRDEMIYELMEENRTLTKQLEDLKIINEENKIEIQKLKCARYDEIMEQLSRKQSYRNAVLASPVMNAPKEIPPPPPEKEIIIKAVDGKDVKDLQKDAADAIKALNMSKQEYKINKIIKSKTGIIIKRSHNTNTNEMIGSLMKIDKLKENAKIYKPTKLDPTIVFKNVSKYTIPTELHNIICKKNAELANQSNNFKFLFTIKSNTDVQDVVYRVAPSSYQALMKMQRVYTDVQSVNFKDRVFIRQCQRCYQFNPDHKLNECKENKCNSCDQSGTHTCTFDLKCHNCAKHPSQELNEKCKHKPNSTDCPLYRNQVERIKSKTAYFPEEETPPEDSTDVQMNDG